MLTVETAVKLLASIGAVYLFHALVIQSVRTHFMTPLRQGRDWGFLKGFSRKILGYVAVPLFFSLFGFGVRLLPNPQVQAYLSQPAVETARSSPYDGPDSRAGDYLSEIDLALTFVGTIIVCCTVRIIAAVEQGNVLWTISYVALAIVGFSVFTLLRESGFYTFFFDSIVRHRYPSSVPWLCVTACLAGLLTEYLLDRFPFRKE